MTDWRMINAKLISEDRRLHADVRIGDGRIECIGGSPSAQPGERVFDVAGQWLMPGMIEDEVHPREPDFEHKASLDTESRAKARWAASPVAWKCRTQSCQPQTRRRSKTGTSVRRCVHAPMMRPARARPDEDLGCVDGKLHCATRGMRLGLAR